MTLARLPRKRRSTVVAAVLVMMLPVTASAAPLTFKASGPDAASIQPAVDAFRAALGEPNNGNAPGPLATGRREINWDGGGQATTISGTPFIEFRNIRGAQFTRPAPGTSRPRPPVWPPRSTTRRTGTSRRSALRACSRRPAAR